MTDLQQLALVATCAVGLLLLLCTAIVVVLIVRAPEGPEDWG